jgi:hypothetical protein
MATDERRPFVVGEGARSCLNDRRVDDGPLSVGRQERLDFLLQRFVASARVLNVRVSAGSVSLERLVIDR